MAEQLTEEERAELIQSIREYFSDGQISRMVDDRVRFFMVLADHVERTQRVLSHPTETRDYQSEERQVERNKERLERKYEDVIKDFDSEKETLRTLAERDVIRKEIEDERDWWLSLLEAGGSKDDLFKNAIEFIKVAYNFFNAFVKRKEISQLIREKIEPFLRGPPVEQFIRDIERHAKEGGVQRYYEHVYKHINEKGLGEINEFYKTIYQKSQQAVKQKIAPSLEQINNTISVIETSTTYEMLANEGSLEKVRETYNLLGKAILDFEKEYRQTKMLDEADSPEFKEFKDDTTKKLEALEKRIENNTHEFKVQYGHIIKHLKKIEKTFKRGRMNTYGNLKLALEVGKRNHKLGRIAKELIKIEERQSTIGNNIQNLEDSIVNNKRYSSFFGSSQDAMEIRNELHRIFDIVFGKNHAYKNMKFNLGKIRVFCEQPSSVTVGKEDAEQPKDLDYFKSLSEHWHGARPKGVDGKYFDAESFKAVNVPLLSAIESIKKQLKKIKD